MSFGTEDRKMQQQLKNFQGVREMDLNKLLHLITNKKSEETVHDCL